MSKAEDRALEVYPKETRDITGFVIDIGHPQYMRDLYIEGYHQAMEDVVEWIDRHWREYVNVDADGVVCFGHWKNDLIKAMKDE